MSRFSLVLVAAIVLPVFILGCGGSGGGASTGGGDGGGDNGLVTIQGVANLGDVPTDQAQILLDGQPVDVPISDDGSFVIPDVPAGDHVIQVVSRDGMRGGCARIRADARSRVHRLREPIALDATGQIAGIVVKRENGVEQRVAGIEVIARSDLVWIQLGEGNQLRPRRGMAAQADDATDALIYPPPPDVDGQVYSAFTDDDGSYVIKGVEPGGYLVTAALPGYEPAEVWVFVEANRTAVADLVLVPAIEEGIATISGTVSGRSSDGTVAPIAGAQVAVVLGQPWEPGHPREPIPILGAEPQDGPHHGGGDMPEVMPPAMRFREFRTLTDQTGHYTLNVPTGEAMVTVWARGYEVETEDVTLRPGDNITLDFVLEEGPPRSWPGPMHEED